MPKLTNAIKRELKKYAAEEIPFTVRQSRGYFFEVAAIQNEINHQEFINGFSVLQERPGDDQLKIHKEVAPDIQRNHEEIHIPVNHFKRIKKEFIKGGWDAVYKYKEWVEANNRKLNKTIPLQQQLFMAREVKKNMETIFKN